MGRAVAIAVLVAGALWGLDRLLLAAEARGWVYWRRRRPTSSALGSVMTGIHDLLATDDQPHVVAEAVERDGWLRADEADGDPPDPRGRRPTTGRDHPGVTDG